MSIAVPLSYAVDTLAYDQRGRQRHAPKSRPEQREEREIAVCLRCPLPSCQPDSLQCPLFPVCGTGGKSSATVRRATVSHRAKQVDRHGAAIQRWLRDIGPATCPEIAAGIDSDEGDIYTAMASLILDHGATIHPCGMRANAAIYRFRAGTASRPFVGHNENTRNTP